MRSGNLSEPSTGWLDFREKEREVEEAAICMPAQGRIL